MDATTQANCPKCGAFIKSAQPKLIMGGGYAIINPWKAHEHWWYHTDDDLKCCENPDWIIRQQWGFAIVYQCVNCLKELSTYAPNNQFSAEFYEKIYDRTSLFYFGKTLKERGINGRDDTVSGD